MRFAAILLVVAGCGGASLPPPATADDPGYPAGPYGYEAGYPQHPPDVIADLLFAGKIVPDGGDSSMVPLAQISVGSLRASERFFVVDVAARWCSDCMADEPSMIQLEHDYAPKGVLGIELVCESAPPGVAAIPADLDAWSRDEGVTGTLLVDHDEEFETAAAIEAFPTYFIIDATTMKIVERTTVTQIAQPLGPTLDTLLAGS